MGIQAEEEAAETEDADNLQIAEMKPMSQEKQKQAPLLEKVLTT